MATRRAYSREDQGDLNTTSIATSRNVDFKDIDLSFKVTTTSGDIFKKQSTAAVKQAIKTLLLTNRLEKPFLATFGGDLQGQLFELADRDGSTIIRNNIIATIERFEPRVKVLNVIVALDPDRNRLGVTVEFKVINTQETVVFETTINRLR